MIIQNMGDEVSGRVQDESSRPNNDEGYDEPYDPSITYSDTRLTNENFMQIKCNDPKIKALSIHLNEEPNINWEHESDCFGNNNNLEILNVFANEDDYENEATNEEARALFRAVARNRSVKKLYLNGLPVKISREVFAILHPLFEQNRNLRSIELMDMMLDNDGAKEFVLALSRCNKTSLQKISIDDSGYSDIDAEMSAKLVDSLSLHKNIRFLDLCLSGNNTVLWCTSLANLLRCPNSKITELDLSYNEIDDDAAEVLANGLCCNNTLKILNLEKNLYISPSGWSALARYFSCPSCSLEVINLSSNDDGITDDVLFSLGTKSTLQDLDISHNYGHDISHDGLRALSALWSHPDTALVKLNLASFELDDVGALILLSSLAQNTKLKYLDLSGNDEVSSTGWQSLLRSISHSNSAIECLNLRSNNLQDSVIPTLVESLSEMRSLKILTLSDNNNITTVGWYALSTLLFNHDVKLEEINMSNHPSINDGVATAFANAIANNTSLSKLLLGYSAITHVGWSALNNVVCNKSSIETIYSSNHTLTCLHDHSHGIIPDELASNLQLNKIVNKTEVARQKTIRNYFANGHENMEAFIEMKLDMVPQAMSWMGRNSVGLSLLFKFVRSVPSFLEHASKVNEASSKRKRVE